MRALITAVAAIVFLLAGTLVPGTAMLYLWPGVLGIAVVGICGLGSVREQFHYRPSGVALWSMLVFFGYLAWRAVTSDVGYLARPDLYLVAGCFLAFVTGAVLCEGTAQRKALVYVWAVLVVGNVVMGCLQFFGDPKLSVLSPWGVYRDIEDRQAGGFFNLGNHLAGFLEAALFPALGVALFGRVRIFARLMLAVVVIAGLLGVVLSTSRGGAISTVAGLVVFVLAAAVATAGKLTAKRVKIGLAVSLAGVLILGGVAAMGKLVFSESFGDGPVDEVLTGESGFRYSLWEMALEQNSLAPVLGTGARTFAIYSRKFMPDSIAFLGVHPGLDEEFAHNDYLQLLAEYGLLGLVLGALAGTVLGWSALKYLWWFRTHVFRETGRASSVRLGVVLGACGSVAALAAHSVVDFNLHVGVNALVVATLAGFLANPGVRREEAGGGGVRAKGLFGRPLLVILAGVCGLWVLWTGLPMLRAELKIQEGVRKARAGEYLVATQMYGEALELDPENYMIYQYRGAAFAQMGDSETIKPIARSFYARAIDDFEYSRALFPNDVPLLEGLGELLSLAAAYDDASGVFEQAIEWAPNRRRLWVAYGLHLVRAGELEEAKTALETALSLKWYGEEPREVQRWLKVIDGQLKKKGEV